MRKLTTTMVVSIVAALSAASSPAFAFFDYQKPPPPVGGDCAAIATEVGPEATWYGEFAGNYFDDFTDRRSPYSARGCFASQYACRLWQNQAISYIGRGGIVYMRCRQGVHGN